jgi:hypothetical protein
VLGSRVVSIKRSKHVSHGRGFRDEVDDSPRGAKAVEPDRSWAEHMEGHADAEFAPYSLLGHFTKGALIAHPTFGRGIVVAVVDRRMDVVFEGGKKTLGHAG